MAFRELRVKSIQKKLTLEDLRDAQVGIFLNLADASLRFFLEGNSEGLDDCYVTFLEALLFLRDEGLLVSIPEVGVQLGALSNLDPEEGFSLDRRLSLLGEPKEIQVWANRVIKLRKALNGEPPREPLRELGYGTSEGDRRFPLLLKAARRIYEMNPPGIEEFSTLLYLEMRLGLEPTSILCRDGRCEEISKLVDVDNFEKVASGDVDVYYRFSSGKRVTSRWGSVNLGTPVEIVVFSRRKNRGFRCVKEAV
nr:hypothetical protein [Thermococcus sp. Bubb.Bath]